MKRMYGMKRFGRNVVNYASVFVMIYMASCFVLGIIGTVVSLVLSIVLTFGFGLDLGWIGFGLGLTICKKIVSAHLGEIGLKINGKKTVFNIKIPIKMPGGDNDI